MPEGAQSSDYGRNSVGLGARSDGCIPENKRKNTVMGPKPWRPQRIRHKSRPRRSSYCTEYCMYSSQRRRGASTRHAASRPPDGEPNSKRSVLLDLDVGGTPQYAAQQPERQPNRSTSTIAVQLLFAPHAPDWRSEAPRRATDRKGRADAAVRGRRPGQSGSGRTRLGLG
jgi:hypothetical protein